MSVLVEGFARSHIRKHGLNSEQADLAYWKLAFEYAEMTAEWGRDEQRQCVGIVLEELGAKTKIVTTRKRDHEEERTTEERDDDDDDPDDDDEEEDERKRKEVARAVAAVAPILAARRAADARELDAMHPQAPQPKTYSDGSAMTFTMCAPTASTRAPRVYVLGQGYLPAKGGR